MYQGNWKCSGCGKEITELPFEPRSTNNLLCRDCHAEQRGGGRGGSRGGGRRERKMVSGNWTCSGCKGAIKELPFEPRETGNLLCRDCFKKNRGM